MVYYVCGWPSKLKWSRNPSDFFTFIGNQDENIILLIIGELVCFVESQTFTKLSDFWRAKESLEEHGQITAASYVRGGSCLAVATSNNYILFYQIEFIVSHGILHKSSIPTITGHLRMAPLLVPSPVLGLCCIDSSLLICFTKRGEFIRLDWTGHVHGTMANVHNIPVFGDEQQSPAKGIIEADVYCKYVEWAPTFGGFVTLLSSGQLLLLKTYSLDGVGKPFNCVLAERLAEPTCMSVNHRFRVVAVGLQSGLIALYHQDESTGSIYVFKQLDARGGGNPEALRKLGGVSGVAWSPNGYALVASWNTRDWVMWTVFGGMLYASFAERVEQTDSMRLSDLWWTPDGYRLLGFAALATDDTERPSVNDGGLADACRTDGKASDDPSPADPLSMDWKSKEGTAELVAFQMAHSSLSTNPTSHNHRSIVLQTSESVIFSAHSRLTNSFNLRTVLLPEVYTRQNWPVKYTALNSTGSSIAIAGTRGFAVYNCLSQRWRVFGNEIQEQAIRVAGGLVWWEHWICACFSLAGTDAYEVRAYPSTEKLNDRYCSRVAVKSLRGKPLLVDCFGSFFYMLSEGAVFHLFTLSYKEQTGRSANSFSISIFQTVDLTNFIPEPRCVVRLCLSSLMVNLPLRVDQTKGKTGTQSGLDSRTSKSHSLNPFASSVGQGRTVTGGWHRGISDASPGLLGLFGAAVGAASSPGTAALPEGVQVAVAANSLIVNYAGSLFVLQPIIDQQNGLGGGGGEQEESWGRRSATATDRSKPLYLAPFLIASNVELFWTVGDTQCPAPAVEEPHSLSADKRVSTSGLSAYTDRSLWLHCAAFGFKIWLPLPQHRLSTSSLDSVGSCPATPPAPPMTTGQRRYGDCLPCPAQAAARRIMLTVDLEPSVYPLVILLRQALLVSVQNDFHRPLSISKALTPDSGAGRFVKALPYGSLSLETETYLPRLIQQLLRKNLATNALELCAQYRYLSHFPRVLEWMLHEVLEEEATSKIPIPDPLLPQVVAFIQEFPHFLETLAECARKTEVARWSHLFTAIGRPPRELFELCLETDNLQAAASYLIIIQSCEPPPLSQQYTLCLLRRAVDGSEWNLARDILRFFNAVDPGDLNYDATALIMPPYNNSRDMRQWMSRITSTELRSTSQEQAEHVKNEASPAPHLITTHNSASTLTRDWNPGFQPGVSFLDQIKQVLHQTALKLLHKGHLKQVTEMVVNLAEFFSIPGDCQDDQFAAWLRSLEHADRPLLQHWPEHLLNLHLQFGLLPPQLGQQPNVTLDDAGNDDALSLQARMQVRSQLSGGEQQLEYLLAQLMQAESLEWACIVAVALLDPTALLDSVAAAAHLSTETAISRLLNSTGSPVTAKSRRNSATPAPKSNPGAGQCNNSTVTTVLHVDVKLTGIEKDKCTSPAPVSPGAATGIGDPLSRVLAGLDELTSWANRTDSGYRGFLNSLRPDLNLLIDQIALVLDSCLSGNELATGAYQRQLPLHRSLPEQSFFDGGAVSQARTMGDCSKGNIRSPGAHLDTLSVSVNNLYTTNSESELGAASSVKEMMLERVPCSNNFGAVRCSPLHRPPSNTSTASFTTTSDNTLVPAHVGCPGKYDLPDDESDAAPPLAAGRRSSSFSAVQIIGSGVDLDDASEHLVDGTGEIPQVHATSAPSTCSVS